MYHVQTLFCRKCGCWTRHHQKLCFKCRNTTKTPYPGRIVFGRVDAPHPTKRGLYGNAGFVWYYFDNKNPTKTLRGPFFTQADIVRCTKDRIHANIVVDDPRLYNKIYERDDDRIKQKYKKKKGD